MKKIECIIRPNKLDDVNNALSEYGLRGMTVTQVMGCGLQKGRKEVYRGTQYDIRLLPKVKIEIIVKDEAVNEIIEIISKTAKTGEIGDGKIFVYSLQNAIRIRTAEEGESAL